MDFDPTLTFYKIKGEKGEIILQKNIFLETRQKEENFDINILIFGDQLVLL